MGLWTHCLHLNMVCLCVCVCVGLHVCANVCGMCVLLCACVQMCVRMHMCLYVCMCVCVCVCVYGVCVCVCVCVYVCVYVCDPRHECVNHITPHLWFCHWAHFFWRCRWQTVSPLRQSLLQGTSTHSALIPGEDRCKRRLYLRNKSQLPQQSVTPMLTVACCLATKPAFWSEPDF